MILFRFDLSITEREGSVMKFEQSLLQAGRAWLSLLSLICLMLDLQQQICPGWDELREKRDYSEWRQRRFLAWGHSGISISRG